MAESSTNMANDPKRKAKSKDIGWNYGFWPDLTNKDVIQCTLCGKKCHGGIKRLKQHLAGTFADVTVCPKTTTEIMRTMHEALAKNRRNKPLELNVDDDDDVEEVEVASNPSITLNAASDTAQTPSSGTASKRKKAAFQFPKPQPKQQKTITSLLRKTPEEVVQDRHSGNPHQTSMENRFRTPEEKQRVDRHIAKFFYENGISFNVANSKSYEIMVESIGQYGPGLKPPSYHELRVPLLKDAKATTDELKKKHVAAWAQYGCTLMSDGWTDKRGRHLVNFLVNSPEGTYFMDSIDASSECHDAALLAGLLDQKIEEIGPEYVVQVVTDNGSNYKAAGQILMRNRPTLFWTPCAAHCLDLMLEDIGNLKDFKSTVIDAKRITTFIYRHGRLLDAMREKTGGRDLVRPAVTRFATSFLTLQSLYKHKDALRFLFNSPEWTQTKLSTSEAGKKVSALVFSTTFWNNVENCIRASQPLLVVLRIVDGDEKPALPEVLAAMRYAKRKIKDSFESTKPRLYKKVIDIVERRWETQMGQTLYGAGLFLNPAKYFDLKEQDPDITFKLRDDFNEVLQKMVKDRDLRAKINAQIDLYDDQQGSFGKEMALEQRKLKTPLSWWRSFGGNNIELAKFARRILGLCCSSSGCERNWSTFEFIHSKKRNRLTHQRLRDLVYVQYNEKIASRFQRRRELGSNFDPLSLDDFDWGSEEWINNGGEVRPGEGLTWNDVDEAMGASQANQGRNLPRSSQHNRGSISATYSRRGSTSRETTLIDEDTDEDGSGTQVDVEEPLLPSDGEYSDDYGDINPPPSNDNQPREADGNDDFMADDYDDFL